MCGILGLASSNPPDESTLIAMRDSLRHRGPDDAGLWHSPDGRVHLAHHRLAIIDLSPDGHQPMIDSSGQLAVTFNGEIYNYRELRRQLEGCGHTFRTASDTEVILEAYREWGTDCLEHLNGMFALGLYDSHGQRLFLARDRAGEKPLYYWPTPDGLTFASELKAFLAYGGFPRRIDPHALECYLMFGYVPGDLCIFAGIKKLAPAHGLSYDLNSRAINLWRYWSLPPPPLGDNVSSDQLAEELDSHLQEAVKRQLVADVPVGILLSGGLDSSLVTAMAARLSSKPVKTFTVSFPGYAEQDEAPYARLVAQHFGTDHIELAAEPASVQLLPQLARQFDEPMADSSMVPTYLVSRLIRQHAKVALGGDGGDELFGGYATYRAIQADAQIRRWTPAPLRAALSLAAAHLLPVGIRGRHHLIGLGGNIAQNILYYNVLFDPIARARLAPCLVQTEASAPEIHKLALCNPNYTPLQQMTRLDFESTLADDYLVKVDRASMLASLEVRAPFLDYQLVEFAFGRVPDGLRATRHELKILPRLLGQRLLPSTLNLNRKQGFSLPLEAWLKNEWAAFAKSVLAEADPSIFDRQVVSQLFEGFQRGLANKWRVFALLLFELWRREYSATLA